MTSNEAIPAVTVGDHGGDPDDEATLVALAAWQREGLVDLRAVVSNEWPVTQRASLAQGTLDELGLNVPVGVGVGSVARANHPQKFDAPYARPALFDGHRLLVESLRDADDGSVALLLTSALSDAQTLFEREPELCRRKLKSVWMMSGAELDKRTGLWVPDGSTNNDVDPRAAQAVFATLQGPDWQHIDATVVSRFAVYAGSKVPPAALEELAAGGSRVGGWLRKRSEALMNHMWTTANLDLDDERRGTFRNRDRAWFVQNLLNDVDPERVRGGDPIFDRLPVVPLYDVVAANAMIEPENFAPVTARASNFKVIGAGPEAPGIVDPEALTRRLTQSLRDGLSGPRLPEPGEFKSLENERIEIHHRPAGLDCIGLFGTTASTWRDPFIDAYSNKTIDWFAPQVENWNQSFGKAERAHFASDRILVFALTGDSYGIGTTAEIGLAVASVKGTDRKMLVYIDPQLDDELADPKAREGCENARRLLVDHIQAFGPDTNVKLMGSLDGMLSESIRLAHELGMPAEPASKDTITAPSDVTEIQDASAEPTARGGLPGPEESGLEPNPNDAGPINEPARGLQYPAQGTSDPAREPEDLISKDEFVLSGEIEDLAVYGPPGGTNDIQPFSPLDALSGDEGTGDLPSGDELSEQPRPAPPQDPGPPREPGQPGGGKW